MSEKLVFVSDDVFFWARVFGLAKSMGREAVRVGDDASMDAVFEAGGVTRVIVDRERFMSRLRRAPESTPAAGSAAG